MAFLLGKIAGLVAANYPVVIVLILIIVFISILGKLIGLIGGSSGPNPFAHSTIRPVEPLVTDLSKRDKVLKQGKY